MWGKTEDPNSAWKRNDPMVNIPRLVANNTRIWIYCGDGTRRTWTPAPAAATCSTRSSWRPSLRTNKTFKDNYLAAGGTNGVFNFPANGTHSWNYWGQQLQQMKPDIQRVLGAVPFDPAATPAEALLRPRAPAPRSRTRAAGQRNAQRRRSPRVAAVVHRGRFPDRRPGPADVVHYLPAAGDRGGHHMKLTSMVLRLVCALILAGATWSATTVTGGQSPVAHAAAVEYLQVPSAAMGRDIPVAFQAGGPHAVFLLDAFNAGPEVSNWVTAGNAMNTLAGKGISVAAPAGGAFSLYTNWEQDGSKQWETFLSTELPDWLAANKGLAPGGHGIVGAAQGGTAALALAEFYPNRFRYAGSLSGFLYPSNTFLNGALHAGMMQFGGVDTNLMWGPAQAGRWKWHDPYVHNQLLIDNNTRLWVFSRRR
jgi:S-formylglutathione hydrolase FrmB